MIQSFALIMMTAMFLICTAFSNNSFDPRFNVLVGLSVANYLAVKREAERFGEASVVPGRSANVPAQGRQATAGPGFTGVAPGRSREFSPAHSAAPPFVA